MLGYPSSLPSENKPRPLRYPRTSGYRIAPSPLRVFDGHSLGIRQTHSFSPRQHFPFSASQPKRNLLDRLPQKPSITQPILRPFVPNKRLPIVASFPKMEMPLDRFMARRLQRPLPTTLLKVLSNPLDDPMPVVLRPMLGDRLGEKRKSIFPHIMNFPMPVRKSSQRRNVAVRLLVNSQPAVNRVDRDPMLSRLLRNINFFGKVEERLQHLEAKTYARSKLFIHRRRKACRLRPRLHLWLLLRQRQFLPRLCLIQRCLRSQRHLLRQPRHWS